MHPDLPSSPPPATGANRPSNLRDGRWFLFFSLGYGLYVALPFLAPVLMHWGLEGPARALYAFYGFFCHQMAQRSFFLFGPRLMYNLADIQAFWQPTTDPLLLRQFVGGPDIGWKVAWSDRMVWMYTSVLLFAWVWWPLRRRVRPLPGWGLALLFLPLALDGFSHLISDITGGIGAGFRYHNAWLAALTGGRLPASFYVGDAVGSFNFWMRLISGLAFGLGVVWWAFPRLIEEAE